MPSLTSLPKTSLSGVSARFARKTVVLAMILATIASCARSPSSPVEAAYDAKANFREGRVCRYPDFELTYLGRRHVTPPQYPRGWWRYDFKVSGGTGEQIVSWSAGTGDIGPAQFTVGGMAFNLELVWSEKRGKLDDDELVVSKAK
jgi:hypothetical protein